MRHATAVPQRRFLIVNPFGIGDVIFSMALVESLRALFPASFIGFLCNERTVDLVRMNMSVDKTFIFHHDRFRKLWKRRPLLFFRKLRALASLIQEERFDTLLDVSLARPYSFLAMFIGIRRRIGLDYKNRGFFLTRRVKIDGYEGRPVAEIQQELLKRVDAAFHELGERRALKIPLAVPETEKKEIRLWFERGGILLNQPVLAIAPGGGKSWGPNAVFKQWDFERFAEVSNGLLARFPHQVVLVGDRGERGLLEETSKHLKAGNRILCGEGLPRVCALLQQSRLLLCNDGGLLHLANALGVRTVSVFGPVDPAVYGPYPRSVPCEVVTAPVACRPCYHRFRFPPCPYERRCLTGISVAEVLQAVEKII